MRVIKERPGATDFAFDPKDLARLYRNLPALVIADLCIQCKGDVDTFAPDPYVHANNAGRRAIWLHINNYLKLDPEQIEEIFRGRGHVVLTEQEIIDG
jgi:hypothetical protein